MTGGTRRRPPTKNHDATGRTKRELRHVRVYHWFMDTEAWQSLDCVARCAYLELAKRYGGPESNNGCIPCSVRELQEALNVGKMTAHRALEKLQERGFIVREKKGHFDFKLPHASEWRLTEFRCDVTGTPPTKDFARWQNSEPGITGDTEQVSR